MSYNLFQRFGIKSIDDLLKLETKPRFHGNGFSQWYLDESVRLHVWHAELPAFRDHNATIHNHRWNMVSNVLLGKLQHRTYDVMEVGGSPKYNIPAPYATHKLIELNGASDPKSPKGQVKAYVQAHVKHAYVLSAGSSYTHNSPVFHDSYPCADMVVTLMIKKPPSVDIKYASILCGIKDAEPIHAFEPSKQPRQEQLISIYEEALKAIQQQGTN